ncbi:hypothetical protein BS47DRAFT_1215577 [Hydnum rufescens UP504]|uniref:Uncharacterized protein n=1 Tax=Hydnum rufescens UP504 TaxID=1448309 RepID=A0A9P6DUU4_9AGAM|nr:hypothetical protein BS47DRAFT_1215577 [Hydnum rufescens UP504]
MTSVIGTDPVLLEELSRLTEDENTRLRKKLTLKKKKITELEIKLEAKKEELAQVRTELDHLLPALPPSNARPTVNKSKAPLAKEVSSDDSTFREDTARVGAVRNAPSYAGKEYCHLNLDKYVFAGSPESMTVFNSWRSWRLEDVHTSDGGSKPLSAAPVWHGDQSGLFELIESVRAKEEKGYLASD